MLAGVVIHHLQWISLKGSLSYLLGQGENHCNSKQGSLHQELYSTCVQSQLGKTRFVHAEASSRPLLAGPSDILRPAEQLSQPRFTESVGGVGKLGGACS